MFSAQVLCERGKDIKQTGVGGSVLGFREAVWKLKGHSLNPSESINRHAPMSKMTLLGTVSKPQCGHTGEKFMIYNKK